MDVVIKTVEFNDLEIIKKISNKILKTKFTKEQYKKIYKGFKNFMLIALKNSKVVGFLVAKLSEKSNCFIIHSMGVLDNYRNQGIGTNLLREIIQRLRELEVDKIMIHVRGKNKKAINFYENFGFEKRKNINMFYSDGDKAVEMEFNFT